MMEEQTSKTNIPELNRELLHLPFDQVVPSDTNPRLVVDKQPFEELKKSIFMNGMLQPIVVRPKGDVYEIIGGHRRFMAIKELAAEHKNDKRFTRVAVVVVDADDDMVPVLQLAENLNRSDLSPVEVADAVSRAVEAGVDPVQLADSLGWTRRNLNRYVQLATAPAWLRDFAREVRVSKKKVDAAGDPVIDPKTSKPVLETERYPGLQFTDLCELLTLFNLLREADAIQLEEIGGEKFRPQAERVTKRLATSCAVEGWSKTKLRDEIRKAKDPKPRVGGDVDQRRHVVLTEDRCVIDLRRAEEVTPGQRVELAAQVTRALAAFKFKTVVITP